MKFIDFFAGVGGFRRGMELAGHECVGFCEYDKFAVGSYTVMHLASEEQRSYLENMPTQLKKNGERNLIKIQKEILKEEYRNGEWYAKDIRKVIARELPRADCWCFGFPCQDISVAGKQLGFNGHRSSLFFAVTRLVKDLEEKDRPKYLFIENVKNLLSVNGGFDFARILIEMDEIGYDAEWQLLNSKDFGVPQNRERVFIVGHLRNRCTRKVFPITRKDGQGYVKQLGNLLKNKRWDNPQRGRYYNPEGIGPALNCGGGGGTIAKVVVPGINIIGSTKPKHSTGFGQHDLIYNSVGIIGSLMATDYKQPKQIAIPVSSPNREKRRQHGRRFKTEGEPMFTLTTQDHHGVAIVDAAETGYILANTLDTNCNKALEEIRIRCLTPKECFRLQGWEDIYFYWAQLVNSNSQLYKQAGNQVTVTVIQAIAERM